MDTTSSPVVDLTMVLDPAELWPDAGQCPDWPYVPPTNLDFIPRGRKAAEDALAALRSHLAHGAPTRDPSPAEQAALRVELFRTDQPENAWAIRHGVFGLGPRGPIDRRPDAVVQAAHIRGYLRRLNHEADRAGAMKAHNDRIGAERNLERAVATHAETLAEYEGLAEAAARHQQRLDDERAFFRRNEIKRHVLPGLSEQARQASNTLGQPMPDLQSAG